MHFIQNIFKRFEQKYVLTEKDFKILQNVLNTHFEKDRYFESKIYNLYFDNYNNDIIINSIEKPEYKEKVRFRSYGEIDKSNFVFFEIKKKYKNTVYKRRIRLTINEYNDYFKNNILPSHDTQIMKEIDYEIKYFNLYPSIFVAYDRLSYYLKEDKNFRITFDTNLRSRFNNLELKGRLDDKNYFDDKMYIMEVKSLYGLPIWFTKVLTDNKIYPRSFSKVGNIYKKEKGMKLC